MDWRAQLSIAAGLPEASEAYFPARHGMALLALLLGPRCAHRDAGSRVLAWPDGTRLLLPATADPAAMPRLPQSSATLDSGQDAFDLLRELLGPDQAQRLSFAADGTADLWFDPLECLAPCEGIRPLLLTRGLAMSQSVPHRLQVPLLDPGMRKITLTFSGSPPHGAPVIVPVDPSVRVRAAQLPGPNALSIELDVETPMPIEVLELDISGHRIVLDAVQVRLSDPARGPQEALPDPLEAYVDPLGQYVAEPAS